MANGLGAFRSERWSKDNAFLNNNQWHIPLFVRETNFSPHNLIFMFLKLLFLLVTFHLIVCPDPFSPVCNPQSCANFNNDEPIPSIIRGNRHHIQAQDKFRETTTNTNWPMNFRQLNTILCKTQELLRHWKISKASTIEDSLISILKANSIQTIIMWSKLLSETIRLQNGQK